MRILLILSRPPFDGTDAAWNVRRFAQTARKVGHDMRRFLLNAAVDLARPAAAPPGTEFNLAEMLRELVRS